jgi:putative tricarboxylic transport membrane protein
MLDLVFVSFAGILVGMLAGLLPALPVFTGPLILYYFVQDYYPIEYLLVFWLASYSGTQFFGSIATITTRIPGEESAAIYLDDIDNLTLEQKRNLLYDTALGSYIAATLSLVFVWIVVTYFGIGMFPQLMSMPVQIAVYSFAILLFFFIQPKKWPITSAIIALGLLIGPSQNYALPDLWYTIQQQYNGYTLYMVVLGTIIFPALADPVKQIAEVERFGRVRNRGYSILTGLRSTLIGAVAGLIPGPSASVATAFAYRTGGASSYRRILNAETANNSAVVTCALPFFLLGLPINQNTLLMSNIMDVQSLDIVTVIRETGMFGWTIFDLVIAVSLFVMVIYFWLSTHLIDFYAGLVQRLHHHMRWVVALILLALIAVDLQYAEIGLGRYLILLASFTTLGFMLRKLKVSAIPFLFAVILADKVIWLGIQSAAIYF